MNDCIFCKITKGEINSYTVYEDDLVKVFLDVNPEENGHMLIVPKMHISDFLGLDDNLTTHINKVAKEMANLAYNKLECDGIRLITNHGICQEVKHFHLHVIPIYKVKNSKDDLEKTLNTLKN